ncbi:homoserine kinase [Salsuginibacillus kocurii]|uniref:homoserine kinase n=1 Tax=Salsuginibacillus kocurii TaxID=427078 RepID=UPI0003695B2F|nr:homoserine kinase [Salsuginibacillus kocurii]
MSKEHLRITVPASSANLGPGFDSIGIAVDLHLVLDVTPAPAWSFTSDSAVLEDVPEGEDNIICEVAHHVARKMGGELPPQHVHMTSDIPLARGLGSSAAAIIAAIELADQLLGTELTQDEKMRFASLWEGHPDNVGPCLYGGMIVGTHSPNSTDIVHLGVPDVDLVLLIPDETLMTKKARGILPRQLEYHQAIKGSSISNVLVAAILKENWELTGKMMGRDVFHHPYRSELIPELTGMLKNISEYGAYGAALSGAGPTVLCLAPKGEGQSVQKRLEEAYPLFNVQTAAPAEAGVKTESLTGWVNAAL